MSETDLVSLEVASAFLGKSKQTLRRWDEDGSLVPIRASNGYRKYDFSELVKISARMDKAKPFVKWAGGKTQLLPELLPRVPETYGKYLEPFLGGGALFFSLNPHTAILNDINAELICTYKIVKEQPQMLIERLKVYQEKHSEQFYYETRSADVPISELVETAARFIYLNKTCFNGLHRVNKHGRFNVPMGNYKNPMICDEKNIILCSSALKNVHLTNLNYAEFLDEFADEGDFVYLDPPYVPLSENSDFDRYAKGKFRLGDQVELAGLYTKLIERGVHAILSNSDTQITAGLYSKFNISRVSASRVINKNADGRKKISEILVEPAILPPSMFPTSRYMGSKTKLLPSISEVLEKLNITSVFDGFGGSGVVSYHFKKLGYRVITNDFLKYSYSVSKAIVENSTIQLTASDINTLLKKDRNSSTFIQEKFAELYFSAEDNAFLDNTLGESSKWNVSISRLSLLPLSPGLA